MVNIEETSEQTSVYDTRNNLIPWKWLENWQPSPELKKAWRERKREASKMMNYFKVMSEKSVAEIKKHVAEQGDNMIIREALICKYIIEWFKDKKIMQDIINRHVSYAPIKQEHTGDEWADLFQNVTFNVVQRPVINKENQQ